jgi:hypothetical protein
MLVAHVLAAKEIAMKLLGRNRRSEKESLATGLPGHETVLPLGLEGALAGGAIGSVAGPVGIIAGTALGGLCGAVAAETR